MPISLRLPLLKEQMIEELAKRTGKTKTAVIVEALDEKFGLQKSRRQLIRELSGWLSQQEAEELRNALKVFETIHAGDWE